MARITLQDHIEKVLASYFSPNQQPHMSGDMRNRLGPDMKRRVTACASDVIEIVRKRMAEETDING